jgi:hypothetical protein
MNIAWIAGLSLAVGLSVPVESDLTGTDWVVVQYSNPETFQEIVLSEDQYRTGCAYKNVYHFGSKKKEFLIHSNDKEAYRGEYDVGQNGTIDIWARILLQIVDTDQECNINTEHRINTRLIVHAIDRYAFQGDTLVLGYTLPKGKGSLRLLRCMTTGEHYTREKAKYTSPGLR